MTEARYKNRKYSVEPYNPSWVQQFKNEAERLRSIFHATAVVIEHIGSTAVPGLAGKSTIDILVTVQHIDTSDELSEKIENIGYRSLGEYIMEGTRLFVKEIDNTRLVNLHILEVDHPHVHEMLVLRDYLRSHPEVVEEYSKLKFDLMKRYPNDYGLYREYKDEWMNKLKLKIQ